MIRRAVVLMSGGVDSSVLAAHLMPEYSPVGLSIDYGQRHVRELASAEVVAQRIGVPLITCQVGHALAPIFAMAKSSQVGQILEDVPLGHYADASMKTTIVPNRNMILLSIAGALAASIEAEVVAYAAHAGDHPIYPDCRPEFASTFSRALALATDGVSLYRPFIHWTKGDIVKHGASLGVPLELTYSCYQGGVTHCGRCGTCVERREAFAVAGLADPTVYE